MREKHAESEIVADQIAGMDAEISKIDRQLAQLYARKNAMAAMKRALSPLAGATSELQPRPRIILGIANGLANGTGNASGQHRPVVQRAVVSLATPAHRQSERASPTSTGFRDAIRAVLRDNPRGLRPLEVRKELEARGELAKYTGQISHSIRVGNALYALKKSGKVARRAGLYTLSVEKVAAASG